MARRFWSEEEIEELRRRYEAKEFLKDIAKAMGRTLGAIKAQVSVYREVWAGRSLRITPAIIGDVTGKNDERRHLRLVVSRGGFAWLRPAVADRLYRMERPLRLSREFWRAA